jgi:hypothetical protein
LGIIEQTDNDFDAAGHHLLYLDTIDPSSQLGSLHRSQNAVKTLPDFVGAMEVEHHAAYIRFVQNVGGSDLKNNREANFAG